MSGASLILILYFFCFELYLLITAMVNGFRYPVNKMLCDCVYAEKNNGMDKGMQLANQVEKLTLDYSTLLAWSTEKMALDKKLGDHQRLPRKQYNYKNCSCFKIKHIHELCELCIRSCRWRAREAYEERKEERGRRGGD